MTNLYNCRAFDHHYTITKFDEDLNPLASYRLDLSLLSGRTIVTCNCAAGSHGRPCRHRMMLPKFLDKERQNTEWMYDADKAEWRQFVGPAKALEDEAPASGYIPFGD